MEVFAARLDEGGVARGACTVADIFILMLVKFTSMLVICEIDSFQKSFQLAALGFEVMKLIGVPWSGVCEGLVFMGVTLSRQEEGVSLYVLTRAMGETFGVRAESEMVDGREVRECYGAFLFDKGGGHAYVQGDSQMVRDGKSVLTMVMPEVQTRFSFLFSFSVGGDFCVLGNIETM